MDGNRDRVIGNLLETGRHYRIFKWINEERENILALLGY